jgi:hypothetical protein
MAEHVVSITKIHQTTGKKALKLKTNHLKENLLKNREKKCTTFKIDVTPEWLNTWSGEQRSVMEMASH